MLLDDSIECSVGIDVSKARLDVHQLPEGLASRVSNSPEGRRELLARLPEPGSCRVVLEATGDFQRALVAALVDAGHYVSVVNPRQVRDYAKALGVLAKTDAIDAKVIARFGRDVKPRNITKAPENQAELDQLVARRRQLVNARVAESNRLKDGMPKLVRQSIQRQVKSIDKDVERLDRAILELVRSDDDWSNGSTSSRAFRASATPPPRRSSPSCRSWVDSTDRRSPPSLGSPPSPTTAGGVKGGDPSAVVAAPSARRSTWRP